MRANGPLNISTTLTDIARDISTLGDSHLLLQSISRRVRQLLATDMAYISLNDLERSETYIESADGVRSAEYASIRMPLGTGVLGLAAGGVVAETPDYLPDEGKMHLPAIDRTVTAEGVRAILGAPLRVAGRVVGALMVANRTPGAFTPTQRTHLDQVATLAAAAVELTNAKRAEAAAWGAAADAARVQAETVASSRVEHELGAALAQGLIDGERIDDLIDLAATVSGCRVHVVTASGETLAVSGELSADASEYRAALVGEAAPGFVVSQAADTGLGTDAVAPTVARFVSIALQYERTIDAVRHFHDDELISSLLTASPAVLTEFSAAALHRALGAEGEFAVAAVAPAARDDILRRRLLARCRAVTAQGKTIVGSYHGYIVAVARSDAATLVIRLSAQAEGFAYFGGIAAASTVDDLVTAHQTAVSIAAAMRSLDRPGTIAGEAEAGIAGLLLGDADPSAARAFIDAHVGALLRDPRGDHLIRTALTYLDTQQGLAETAERLIVHPNTVRQRVGRIDALLGPGWRRGPRSVDTHVALRLWQLGSLTGTRA